MESRSGGRHRSFYREWPGQTVPTEDYVTIGTIADLRNWLEHTGIGFDSSFKTSYWGYLVLHLSFFFGTNQLGDE